MIKYLVLVQLVNTHTTSQGFLCVAGPHVVAPKSPPVVCWPAIGPWQSAIGVAAHIVERVVGWQYFWDYLLHGSVFC